MAGKRNMFSKAVAKAQDGFNDLSAQMENGVQSGAAMAAGAEHGRTNFEAARESAMLHGIETGQAQQSDRGRSR